MLRKILQKAGPAAGIVLAALVILLLVNRQPKLRENAAEKTPPVTRGADAQRELVEMRVAPFLQLLQQKQGGNESAFAFAAADTAGKTLNIRFNNTESCYELFFNGQLPDAASGLPKLYAQNDILLTENRLSLPIVKNGKLKLVRLPALMAFSLAKR